MVWSLVCADAPVIRASHGLWCCRSALFDGAAVSAFFAVILVILFAVSVLCQRMRIQVRKCIICSTNLADTRLRMQVCAVYYMIFTRKGEHMRLQREQMDSFSEPTYTLHTDILCLPRTFASWLSIWQGLHGGT